MDLNSINCRKNLDYGHLHGIVSGYFKQQFMRFFFVNTLTLPLS